MGFLWLPLAPQSSFQAEPQHGALLQNIRIRHTIILDDPFEDPPQLAEHIPENSPEPVMVEVCIDRAIPRCSQVYNEMAVKCTLPQLAEHIPENSPEPVMVEAFAFALAVAVRSCAGCRLPRICYKGRIAATGEAHPKQSLQPAMVDVCFKNRGFEGRGQPIEPKRRLVPDTEALFPLQGDTRLEDDWEPDQDKRSLEEIEEASRVNEAKNRCGSPKVLEANSLIT